MSEREPTIEPAREVLFGAGAGGGGTLARPTRGW